MSRLSPPIQQQNLVVWNGTDKEDVKRERFYVTHLVWEIPALPDFSAPKYAKSLGDSVQQRVSELVKNSLRSLQSFHGLGGDHIAAALRLVHTPEEPDYISAFFIIRVALSPHSLSNIASLQENYKVILPNRQYYRYIYLDPIPKDDTATEQERAAFHQKRRQMALSVREWATRGLELCKQVELLRSVASMNSLLEGALPDIWDVPASQFQRNINRMDEVCTTLREQPGWTMVDVTLCPAQPGEEVQVLNQKMQLLRDYAECLRQLHRQPTTRDIPEEDANLKRALDVCNALHGALTEHTTPWFFYAFRIFTSGYDPQPLAKILSSAATKTKMAIVSLHSDKELFDKSINAVESVDIVPEINQGEDVWERVEINRSLYRLHKMVSLDEVGGFWTLPVPLGATFPGFNIGDVDSNIGLRLPKPQEKAINLGADENGKLVTIQLRDVTRHMLVVGTPGSGKTATLFHILYELRQQGIPWLVMEPAKTEYRALKSLFPDILVFTLGDELVSPFRFNPFDVPAGTPLEKHMSRLYSCFLGAFNLFDPLPMFFDKAIRRVYARNHWSTYDVGGEGTPQAPTISDMYSVAEEIAKEGKYEGEIGSNIRASFVNRLEALQRGSIGRMMNVRRGLSLSDLMQRNVILELDALNADEKSLMMMFIFTHIYEYAKARHTSKETTDARLKHVLVLEEAHNLIGYSMTGSSERANPKLHAIELFTNMLAEMRALGEGIIIADQLPSALAPQAMKNTNIKILHQLVAGDDRKAIGLTMGMGDDEDKDPRLKEPVTFQPGEAFVFTGKAISRIRRVPLNEDILKLKDLPPPDDASLKQDMLEVYIETHPEIFMPFEECSRFCSHCIPKVREWAEQSIVDLIKKAYETMSIKDDEVEALRIKLKPDKKDLTFSELPLSNETVRTELGKAVIRCINEELEKKPGSSKEATRRRFCVYVHFMNTQTGQRCTHHEELLEQMVNQKE